MAAPIPSYSQPCLSSRKDTQTVYLVGASTTKPNSPLEVNIIDITNTSNSIVQQTYLPLSTTALSWNRNAPNVCSPYLGISSSVSEYAALHIQQFGVNTSWSTSFFPDSGSFLNTRYYFSGTAFTSRRSYAFVGYQGINAWIVALTNGTIPWKALQLNADTGKPTINSKVAISEPEPLLVVGTFTISSASPAPGHIIVFNKMGTGSIYPTLSYENLTIQGERVIVSASRPVNMNGITLTAGAVYATLNSSAYILDKANDGTIATYFIDPTTSNALQRISTLNNSPPFASTMAATISGSQIVLYSTTNDGQARFYFLNITTNEWDKPFQPIPIPDSSPSSQPPDNPNSSTITKIWAIVGGVVAGMVVIAVVAFFLIRRRRRQISNNDSNDSRDGKEELETTDNPSSREYAPSSHPQFQQGLFH
ncbi:MAG: hypothetical protein J3R72DRAFT_262727 [Linnemannia gamsii]|nr:MAG: hypothetical protein J3R72DRAFT_262727 [Linnemannia gamsii]